VQFSISTRPAAMTLGNVSLCARRRGVAIWLIDSQHPIQVPDGPRFKRRGPFCIWGATTRVQVRRLLTELAEYYISVGTADPILA
jgi:hypothetical protein